MVTTQSLLIPRVIGHRGAAARAPENTLAGFRRAAELGCSWVEFDVRLTGDDRLVVFHDDTLERITAGAGAVGAMPLDELLKRDVGGEPIPTLAQALAQLRASALGGNLELKAEAGREATLAAAVAEAFATAPVPPLLVSSFSLPALAAFARAAPDVPRGVLMERLMPGWLDTTARLGAIAIVCDHENLQPHQARDVRISGRLLLTYTVNDPARARDLFAWGVDAVISDAPDTILAALS
ncbi:MAG TPA: glycerophosphodiester phosphodiesterase family protein [Stellaceae bacterium]|jgi:glycerophosphoryl diester phosphodiesterase|nr:glycerophosphodiester phosphodiesterase family protein [Stellaceae bacterium]